MDEARAMPLKLNTKPEIYLDNELFPKAKKLRIEEKGTMEIKGEVISERKFEGPNDESKLVKTIRVFEVKPIRKNLRII